MEEQWLAFLRENHPALFRDAQQSCAWQAKWRDNEITDWKSRAEIAESAVDKLTEELKYQKELYDANHG
jgi:hypothetical protein